MGKSSLTRVSKYLSLILRHKPEVADIELDKHGWAEVSEILRAIKVDMNTLEKIVNTDEKMRYSFNDDKTLIRANQGHSVDVDVELEEKTPNMKLYHGTVSKALDSIMEQGLSRQTRKYVHLSVDIETAIKVGSRRGKPVILEIDAERMSNDGYKFFVSKNNVWLVDAVPVEYINIHSYLED